MLFSAIPFPLLFQLSSIMSSQIWFKKKFNPKIYLAIYPFCKVLQTGNN